MLCTAGMSSRHKALYQFRAPFCFPIPNPIPQAVVIISCEPAMQNHHQSSKADKKKETKTKIKSDENQKGVSVKAQKNL